MYMSSNDSNTKPSHLSPFSASPIPKHTSDPVWTGKSSDIRAHAQATANHVHETTFADILSQLIEIEAEYENGLLDPWQAFEREYFPEDYGARPYSDFLPEVLTQLKGEGRQASWIYLVASGIARLHVLSFPTDIQQLWLQKFLFLFQAVRDKKPQAGINELGPSETYFITSLRYCVAMFFSRPDVPFLSDWQHFFNMHQKLVEMDVWRLGCVDRHDKELLEKITAQTDKIPPGRPMTEAQYFKCFAMMLFRKPCRLAINLNSDQMFLSTVANRIETESQPFDLDDQIKNPPYRTRSILAAKYPEEYWLWYLENYGDIASFKDIHKGEACFIVGNGPSLNKMNLSHLRNKVTFGQNKVYLLFDKLGFEFSYMVIIDPIWFPAKHELSGLSAVKFYSNWGRAYTQKRDDVSFVRIEQNEPYFKKDITQGVFIGSTVTYVSMQIAYYMGFETVVLIGVDHFWKNKVHGCDDEDHFDKNYIRGPSGSDSQQIELAYREAKRVFEEDGRQILDATVDGKLQVFPKISYRDALQIT